MSVHVTVSNNPVCINRSKVLLADLDLAKKNEWNRRRKLRLQQVRQQSRDLACTLRQKCDKEIQLNVKINNEENEQEFKQWQLKQLQKLQEVYDKGVAALGSGHKGAATCKKENDELDKEKQLRDALAKARGDLARERTKIASAPVKPKSATVTVKYSPKVIKSPVKKPQDRVKSWTVPANDVRKNDFSGKNPRKKETSTKQATSAPTECTIHSPKTSQTEQIQRKVQSKIVRRQLSCSETSSDEDCDISIVTWPLHSSKVSKVEISPKKVTFYNHDQKLTKDYVKPTKSVTHIGEKTEEMEKLIHDEEVAAIKKSEIDAALRKKCDSRGQLALKRERLDREFRAMERQYTEVEKQQRIARIFELPYPLSRDNKDDRPKNNEKLSVHAAPSTSAEPTRTECIAEKATMVSRCEEKVAQELKKCFDIGALNRSKNGDKKLSMSFENQNPFTLKNLIKDLEKERDILLNCSLERSAPKDHQESVCLQNSIEEKTKRTDEKSPVENQLLEDSSGANKKGYPHPLEVNVISRPICQCCDTCACTKGNDEEQKKDLKSDNAPEGHVSTHLEEMVKNSVEPHHSSQFRDKNEKIDESSTTDKACNDKDKLDRSYEEISLTSDGIRITVKVKELNNNGLKSHERPRNHVDKLMDKQCVDTIPWNERFNDRIDNNANNSNSSYCSPPRTLTETQQAVLNSILMKMCLKNKNPELHKYIKRLLVLSKSSVQNLPVSSPSEVSVHSDIFTDINVDPDTGTYHLNHHKAKSNKKKLRFTDSKSRVDSCNITRATKKVVHLNSSSEEMNTDVMQTQKETQIASLADEYSLRLKELIQMLNQVSPKTIRGSEVNGNDSSSYIRPPLYHPLISFNNGSSLENSNSEVHFEELGDVANEASDISAYVRNHITSLGLPFELLPKPFKLDDVPSLSESQLPIPNNKFCERSHQPRELSTIAEVSSQVYTRDQLLPPSRNLGHEDIDLDDEYLSDTDLLDISSIKGSSPQKLHKEDGGADTDGRRILLADTSSLSILSHMTNESLIDILTDREDTSSDYIEEVFRSLGIGWALSTFRKTRQSRQKVCTSTSSTSYDNSYIKVERKRPKSSCKTVKLNHSHSTPKKESGEVYSSASSVDEEVNRKFKALKSEKLSLTPPDLTLKLPDLGSYKKM